MADPDPAAVACSAAPPLLVEATWATWVADRVALGELPAADLEHLLIGLRQGVGTG